MTGATIAGLLIQFGPVAFDFLHELASGWKREWTPDEVKAFIESKKKTYDEYIAAERARRQA